MRRDNIIRTLVLSVLAALMLCAPVWAASAVLTDAAGTQTAVTGKWVKKGSGRSFVLSDGTKAKGWLTVGSKTYYLKGSKGTAAAGLTKVAGRRYYFSKSGVMQKNKWVTKGSSKYYVGKDGAAYTGIGKIKGKLYVFKKNGKLNKSASKKIEKKLDKLYETPLDQVLPLFGQPESIRKLSAETGDAPCYGDGIGYVYTYAQGYSLDTAVKGGVLLFLGVI